MSANQFANQYLTPQQLAKRLKWVSYGGGNGNAEDEDKDRMSALAESGPLAARLLLDLAEQNKSSRPQNAIDASDAMTGGRVLKGFSPDTEEYEGDDEKPGARASLSPERRQNLTQAGLKAEIGKAVGGAAGSMGVGGGASLAKTAAQKTGKIVDIQSTDVKRGIGATPIKGDTNSRTYAPKESEGSAESWEDWAEDFYRRDSDWFDTKGSAVAGWTQGLANALDSWTSARMFKRAQKLGGGYRPRIILSNSDFKSK